jgi:hypothetical protein
VWYIGDENGKTKAFKKGQTVFAESADIDP